VRVRIAGLLRRRGLLDEPGAQDLAERSPTLAAAQAASVQGRLAFGPRRGQRVTRVGAESREPYKRTSREDCAVGEGFSLHVGPAVSGTDRERLERLCRYAARPAIATERLRELPDGRISYELRLPWSDGTTAVVFEPLVVTAIMSSLGLSSVAPLGLFDRPTVMATGDATHGGVRTGRVRAGWVSSVDRALKSGS